MVEDNLERTQPKKREEQDWVTRTEIRDKLIELGFNVQSKAQMETLLEKLVDQGILITKTTKEGEKLYGTLL